MAFRAFAAVSLAAIALTSLPVDAACGPGRTPTYADIQSVSYARTGCFGRCPAYEVHFSDYGDCEYVGELYVDMPGTYGNDCPSAVLQRAIAVLRLHDFYALNYDSHILVTDVPHYVVAATRCGVTTKLDWPAYEDRRDIESLLDALDKITTTIHWKKKSDSTEPTWIQ